MTASAGNRHLTASGLLEHWAGGVPVVMPVAGEPPLRVTINPARGSVSLRAPMPAEADLPSNSLAHVRVESIAHEGERFLEVSTTDERLLVDGYAMLTAIADRIQLDGRSAVAALEETLATWRAILATRVRMSPEAEVGLVGELLVLEALLNSEAAPSVRCWKAIHREEHDFGLSDIDLEVKTTSGERRQHWIHGLGQLLPTAETPLWLLSIQVTRGGAGPGRPLPELIEDLIAAAAPEERELLRQGLMGVGWRAEESDLFVDRWRLRSAPAAFLVDDSFPRLTAERLSAAGVDVAAIRQVAYEVDVTNRSSSSESPATIANLLSEMQADADRNER